MPLYDAKTFKLSRSHPPVFVCMNISSYIISNAAFLHSSPECLSLMPFIATSTVILPLKSTLCQHLCSYRIRVRFSNGDRCSWVWGNSTFISQTFIKLFMSTFTLNGFSFLSPTHFSSSSYCVFAVLFLTCKKKEEEKHLNVYINNFLFFFSQLYVSEKEPI